MKSKINGEKTDKLQEKYGAGVLAIDNPKSGTTFITVLDEKGNYHSGGSDRGADDETDNQNEDIPLFEDEKKQQEYLRRKTQVRSEILRSYRKGGGTFKNFKGISAKADLRDLKSGGQKLEIEFIKRALELDDDGYEKLIQKSPRLAENLAKIQNKPISTLRRAFSPAGKDGVEEMIEDVGEDSTSSLIGAIETFFD